MDASVRLDLHSQAILMNIRNSAQPTVHPMRAEPTTVELRIA
jgi:hypothetical protein